MTETKAIIGDDRTRLHEHPEVRRFRHLLADSRYSKSMGNSLPLIREINDTTEMLLNGLVDDSKHELSMLVPEFVRFKWLWIAMKNRYADEFDDYIAKMTEICERMEEAMDAEGGT